MSTRKGQNSILFLTTLGVYLGLVIAGGASPQVFAHPAATTRNFDITDEIEFKDDLDKKPDPASEQSEFGAHAAASHDRLRSVTSVLKQFRPVIDLDAAEPNSYFQFNKRALVGDASANCFIAAVALRPRSPRLSVLHLPRASIDPILATDAK